MVLQLPCIWQAMLLHWSSCPDLGTMCQKEGTSLDIISTGVPAVRVFQSVQVALRKSMKINCIV